MELQYLIFDFSDEESGQGSFDAMASVPSVRLPALLGEIEAVLGWASREFGPPALADESEWGFELQGSRDADGAPLRVTYDERGGAVSLDAAGARVTLSLTLSGSAAFCQALRERFDISD